MSQTSYEEYFDTDNLKTVPKDKQEFSKMTPLLMLAKFGDETLEMFKKLIDNGAEINAKDS